MPTFLTAFGETKTLLDWTKDPRCIVSLATLLNRIRDKWVPEEALATPSNSPADRWKTPITAYGESKSLLEWEHDSRAQALAPLILKRLRQGWAPEEAIATAPPRPASEIRAQSRRLYHGKTLNELMQDPRCKVSRYTLERNLRAHMPLEEALVYRKRQRSPAEASPMVDTVHQAVDLLRTGELWHYVGTNDEHRFSILNSGKRFELPKPLFDEMLQAEIVRLVSHGETIRQYALS
jgi:hypothetical protein